MRLFVAITPPEDIVRTLSLMQGGVPGARWQTGEQMHLTLRFIGEVDGRVHATIDDALAGVGAPGFTLRLKGVGEFGGSRPRALWAGVESSDALLRLQRKIETSLQRAGLEPEPRKFSPHITLARLRATPPGAVMDYLVDHALYASPPFTVEGFSLFSSRPTSNGSQYRRERAYPLQG
ncbi:MAG TPA: RNA 2',3'-cyclic phosphodiesterase [Rhizomicrobium sp.]|jgi:2'-5' RNA ligase|nr:RNA 2',3'-cyclic phosphodiesterase [Rhizomicrobium sp.]